jgi:predicted ATPase
MAQIRSAISGTESVGMRASSFVQIPLVETYLMVGRSEEAARVVTAMLKTVHETGHRLQEAELYRLKGELLLRKSGSRPEAEASFRRAIEVAQSQSAKWWELRATTSLARLLTKQGRHNEARTMLAEIYGWFTEGFDTRDLQEAKQLLNELDQES